MQKRFTLNYSEFYITHVCNLNCSRCNRFNNYKFKGHQTWNDYANDYASWADILHINEIGIIGGEPLLNPDFPNWVLGISSLWPDSKIRIITNGTQMKLLSKHKDVFKKCANRLLIDISVHNCEWMPSILQEVQGLISDDHEYSSRNLDVDNKTWQDSYNSIKDIDWPACNTYKDFQLLPHNIQQECRVQHDFYDTKYLNENINHYYKDSNGISYEIKPSIYFEHNALKLDAEQNTLTLHKSDPNKAIKVCPFKPCHHFMRGKLYKCGPVGIFADFVKQFVVDTDTEQNKLIHSYIPAEHDWTEAELDSFLQGLINADAIPQCSLCPETLAPARFKAGTNKIKIKQIT